MEKCIFFIYFFNTYSIKEILYFLIVFFFILKFGIYFVRYNSLRVFKIFYIMFKYFIMIILFMIIVVLGSISYKWNRDNVVIIRLNK